MLVTPANAPPGLPHNRNQQLLLRGRGGRRVRQNPEPSALICWGLLSGPCSIVCLLHCAVAVQRTATSDQNMQPQFLLWGDGLASDVACSPCCSELGTWLFACHNVAVSSFVLVPSSSLRTRKGMHDRRVQPPLWDLRQSIPAEATWSRLCCTYLQGFLEGGRSPVSLARIQDLVVAVDACLDWAVLNEDSQLLLQGTARRHT